MEEKKEVKVSLGTVICIFIILALIVALAVMYLYYNNKLEYKNTELNNSTTEKQYLESEKTIDNTIGTNGDVNITYIKKSGKNGILTLPQINDETEGAKSINEKINKIYNLDEIQGVSNTRVCTELIEYKNKNLMGIAINLEHGADNGIDYYFYYDIDTKKEFTLKDIIENEGFSLSDINNKYQETLNSLAEIWQEEIKGRDYTITGDEMFYTRNESSEEVGHYVNTLNIVIPIDKAYCRMNNKIYSVTVQYKYIDGYFQF